MSESRPWLHDLTDIRNTELADDLPHETETLSRQVHIHLNAGDYSNPLWDRVSDKFQHTTPDFNGFTDMGRGAVSLKHILEGRRRMTEANPDYRSLVTDSHTYIDRSREMTDVMLVIRHVGLAGGRDQDGIQILRWKKLKGGWTCTRSTTMRCAPMLTDAVTPFVDG